jgi:predicted phage terminase large subunit-like protein
VTNPYGATDPNEEWETEAVKRELHSRAISEDAATLSQSLSKFAKAGWEHARKGVAYRHNWHIDAICEHLEAVSADQIRRLQIWVPPVSMKSYLVSVFWPAWEWTTRPQLKYWSASYETRFAARQAAKSRDLMLSQWYRERWGDQFSITRDAEFFFGNSEHGTRLSTSPQSTGTGEHGDRILIDDPISAQDAEAHTKTNLNYVNEVWYDGTVSTRGLENHARVIIMQRLHENDLAAHALEVEDWIVLALPERFWKGHPYAWRGPRTDMSGTSLDGTLQESKGSTYGPGDPRQEDNELLWPDYRPEAVSSSTMKQLKHRASGQYQQWPTPREGQMLLRTWWRFYDPKLFDESLRDRRELEKYRKRRPKLTRVIQSIDTPLKDKETNDHVSIQAWGVKGADRFLIDIRTGHMSYPQAKRAIIEQARYVRSMFPRIGHKVLIENAGYGPELIIDLKRKLTGVEKISAGQDGDKTNRADAASDDLESGNCWLPGIGGGADETLGPVRTAQSEILAFIEELALFPNGAHDDRVDAWSQCMNWERAKIRRKGRTSSPFSRRRRASTRAAA